jgi:hypothetical protein
MKNQKDQYKKVCEYLGCDLDSAPCQRVKEYLAEHPNCEIYIDKIKKVVDLYKTIDKYDEIPEDACNKLLSKLGLNDITQDSRNSDNV